MPPVVVSRATVRAAQILLVAMGFLLDLGGILGVKTRNARKEFQRRTHLPRTGELDAATLKALHLPAHQSSAYVVHPIDLHAGWLR